MRGTEGLRQQGMYAMTSSGRPLGYLNRGWPDPDPKAVLQAVREAKAKFDAMSPAQRNLDRPLGPGDKVRFGEHGFRKPPGTLAIRVASRGLPYPGMNSHDQRNPIYFHTDRLWFKPSEWRAFLPARLAVGQSTEVRGPARTRLVLLSHHQAGHSAWWEEHIRGGRTVSRVVKVEGPQVHLEIAGDYDMKADSQWCKDTYRGRLLGRAVYDQSRRAFTRFDLAMLGTHTVGIRQENLHAGDLTARIAMTGSLAPEDGTIPQQWKYGYGGTWPQTP